jgi:hypothetical protein
LRDDHDRVAAFEERIAEPSFCQCVPCVSFASSLRATRARNVFKKMPSLSLLCF